MTGTNFSSWFRVSEGTLYGECIQPANSPANNTLAYITENTVTQSQRIELRASGVNNLPRAYIIVPNTSCDFTFSSITLGTPNKLIIAYAVDDFAGSNNASAVQTDGSGSVPPSPVLMTIGFTGTSNHINGTIKKIAYYPARLTNTELQGLTS